MPGPVSDLVRGIEFPDMEIVEQSEQEARVILLLQALAAAGEGRAASEAERLAAEVEHLRGDVESLKDMLRAAMKRVAFLEAENERLRRAN